MGSCLRCIIVALLSLPWLYLLAGCGGTSEILTPAPDVPARPIISISRAAFMPTMTGLTLQVDLQPYLNLRSTPSRSSYHWYWGDGNHRIVTSPTTAYTYAAPGSYTVRVMICDREVLRDELSMALRIVGDTGITRVNPVDGAVMRWVPAGSFQMGSTPEEIVSLNARFNTTRFACEGPRHIVAIAGFFAYQTEVSVGQFRQFCRETGYLFPGVAPEWGWDNESPMTFVSWADATAYAAWASGRLPTEAEWERAARGDDDTRYPWGNVWDAMACANWDNSTNGLLRLGPSQVGGFPAGANRLGVMDMAGNVWEWCADWFAADYYHVSPSIQPIGPTVGAERVMRGGGWSTGVPEFFRCAFRWQQSPEVRGEDIGFRCVVDARPPVLGGR